MNYFVTVEGRELEIELDGDDVILDGERLRAQVQELPGTPVQIVVIGTQVHRVLATRGDHRGQYTLSVGGRRFAVEALDERARAIRELSGASVRATGPGHLVAPMPGLIVRVGVSEGDVVRAGQGVLVMEAMKMENELRAAASGKVRRVLVAPGSVVEKGATLIEMESADSA